MIAEFITNFGNNDPLLFNAIIALLSLIVVAKAADLLVFSIANYSRRLGMSEYVIGFIALSIGGAMPELIASLTGSFYGSGEIIYGTVLGSNLTQIPILGMALLLGSRLKPDSSSKGNAPILTFIIALLPILLVIDGTLSRFDGLILLGSFIFYLGNLWQGEQSRKKKKDLRFKDIYKDMLIFIGSLAALLLSARFLVSSSLRISGILDISPFIIGIVVIGIGGAAPEIIVQLRSVFQHHEDFIYGNVLGSIVANSSFVLGIVALIKPFSIPFSSIILTSIFMVAGLLYVLLVLNSGEFNWKHGLIMIIFYIIFIVLELIFWL